MPVTFPESWKVKVVVLQINVLRSVARCWYVRQGPCGDHDTRAAVAIEPTVIFLRLLSSPEGLCASPYNNGL